MYVIHGHMTYTEGINLIYHSLYPFSFYKIYREPDHESLSMFGQEKLIELPCDKAQILCLWHP